MYKVLETRDEEDLSSLRDYLFSLNMEHRISESGGRQILWVYRLEDAEIVIRAYEQFKTFPKASQTRLTSLALIAGPSRGLLAFIRTAPVTSLLVLSSLLIFILTSEDEVLPTNYSALIGNLFFSPVTRVENQFFFVPLEQVLLSGEWWRLITPMFVHFSWIHIVFNLLWCVELGGKVEKRMGAFLFIVFLVFSSLSSNLMQYFIYGPSFFGGLSGVVYALFGYCFAWGRIVPHRKFNVPEAIYVFMLIFLGLGFSDLSDLLGIGKIANGAHLGGLMFGLLFGSLIGRISNGAAGSNVA